MKAYDPISGNWLDRYCELLGRRDLEPDGLTPSEERELAGLKVLAALCGPEMMTDLAWEAALPQTTVVPPRPEIPSSEAAAPVYSGTSAATPTPEVIGPALQRLWQELKGEHVVQVRVCDLAPLGPEIAGRDAVLCELTEDVVRLVGSADFEVVYAHDCPVPLRLRHGKSVTLSWKVAESRQVAVAVDEGQKRILRVEVR